MVPPVPLFPGIPGGIEILVVLLILVVPLVLLALAAVGIGLFGRESSNDAEVERLERRVEELEREHGDADRTQDTGRTRDADRSGWDGERN